MASPPVHAVSSAEAHGLSIVLPCYNRGAYLAHWLAAWAWWQPYDLPIEIIVVDDGGADHTEEIVERWRERAVDVQYLRLRAPGAPRNNGQARNAGLRAAQFSLVLNSDPDIVFATDIVRHLVASWRPGTFCSVSGYYPLTRRASRELWRCHEKRPLEPDDYLTRIAGRQNLVHSPDGVHGLHGAFLCDTATLVKIRGYDERFQVWGWEDRDLLTRLERGLGLTRQYVAGATVVHQWHPALRTDEGADRSRVLWQMGWQRACATTAATVVRNPTGWGDAHLTADAVTPRRAWLAGDATAGYAVFDAYLYEAQVWRREGQPRVAMERLHVALARWWEWGDAEASDLRPLEVQVALAQAAGSSQASALAIEYAAAAADAGDRRRAELALQAAALDSTMQVAIANLRARWLVEGGRLEEAVHLLEQALTSEPAVSMSAVEANARLVDALIRLDRLDAARSRVVAVLHAASPVPVLDVFERLLFEAYRVRARGDASDGEPWPPRIAGAGAGEFLFSVAVRARRAGLLIGALTMFEAYLALDEGEDDLAQRAMRARDDAREASGLGSAAS